MGPHPRTRHTNEKLQTGDVKPIGYRALPSSLPCISPQKDSPSKRRNPFEQVWQRIVRYAFSASSKIGSHRDQRSDRRPRSSSIVSADGQT